MSAPDPFSARFDTIEVDRQNAPSAAAIDRALSACALDQPGFYLVSDAGGRFAVDRVAGVISLLDEALLGLESGAIYPVRLRVVEPSGASYELDLSLRLTGRVPQVVGAEEFAAIAGVEAPVATPPSATRDAVTAPWTFYAAACGRTGKKELAGAWPAFIACELPQLSRALETTQLHISESLPAHGAAAPWSL
jgi:hypothetical protein